MIASLAAAAFVATPLAVPAQWLDYKTPGVPRTADGKPNLSAPAPRMADDRPDFSGSWRGAADRTATDKAFGTIKPQPWAEALYKQHQENLLRDDPQVSCLPGGPVLGLGKMVQTPNLLLMLFEGTAYRQVFLDGRELPKDPNPDWMGYSVGHWEGDCWRTSHLGCASGTPRMTDTRTRRRRIWAHTK
jgi:hypothetical protein